MTFEIDPVAEHAPAGESLFNRLAAETTNLTFSRADSWTKSPIADALAFTGSGAALGAGTELGGAWVAARSAETLGQGFLNLVSPFIGETTVAKVPMSLFTKPFGWRGAVVGAAVGLVAYGGYEGYKYLFGKTEA
jgi:hypothetical protein